MSRSLEGEHAKAAALDGAGMAIPSAAQVAPTDAHAAVREQLCRHGFWIGEWLVEPMCNRVQRQGQVRALRHKAMELLLLLAARAGDVVPREVIVASIWHGNDAVAVKGIANTLWTLRQTLDDNAEQPRIVETIPRRGYRLLLPCVLAGNRPGAETDAVRTAAQEAVAEPPPPRAASTLAVYPFATCLPATSPPPPPLRGAQTFTVSGAATGVPSATAARAERSAHAQGGSWLQRVFRIALPALLLLSLVHDPDRQSQLTAQEQASCAVSGTALRPVRTPAPA